MSGKLNARQRKAIDDLRAFVGASERQAHELLASTGWDVSIAADTFLMRGMVPEAAVSDPGSVEAEFLKYAERDADGGEPTVQEDGLAQLADALDIDMFSDVAILLVCFVMGAKSSGCITKEEWHRGFAETRSNTVEELKANLPDLRRRLEDDEFFRRFYVWAFDFHLDSGRKTLELDMAAELSKLVFNKERFPLLDDWVAFLPTQAHALTRDAWAMLFEFARETKPDLSDYDDTGAWPVVIDDFVDFVRAKSSSGSSGGGGGATGAGV